MTSVISSFQGPFKYQESQSSAWERKDASHEHFECRAPKTGGGHHLLDSEKYQLMDEAVQPASTRPLYTTAGDRLSHIVVDVVQTKPHDAVQVMFVSSHEGSVKKLSVLPETGQTCLLEVLRLGENLRINKMKLLKNSGRSSIYLTTDFGLIRLRVERCSRFSTREACIDAMDPYCGWNTRTDTCTTAPGLNPLLSSWEQSLTECPRTNVSVDGSWSAWSPWFPCSHLSDYSGSTCMCRKRTCDNPKPQGSGRDCPGLKAEVTNCTRHGRWTSWSAWSSCSQSCGLAVKTRRRSCGNPSPRHGGQECVGPDRNEILCTSNPPCPAKTVPPVDGHWSPWGQWDECSVRCGGGFRVRRRSCNSPAPRNGGQDCTGCGLEYGQCNRHPCPEVRKVTPWTPWLTLNSTKRGGATQQRFRFSCKAPVIDQVYIKIGHLRTEDRTCDKTGWCTGSGKSSGDLWTDWGSWSECTAKCDGGVRRRTRACDTSVGAVCNGQNSEQEPCNMDACGGVWDCWSAWSSCSVSCGLGSRVRSRRCLNAQDRQQQGYGCLGPDVGQESCERPACESLEGWESWTVWSRCDSNREQHRRRRCVTTSPGPHLCQGHNHETRLCVDEKDAESLATTSIKYVTAGVSTGHLVGACVGCFIFGALVSGIVVYYYSSRKRQPGLIPSSPHYITKPNHYVTVPSNASDWKSSSSITDSLTKSSVSSSNSIPMKTLKETETTGNTATIRRNSQRNSQRNSHSNGHGLRADLLDAEVFS